MMTPLGKAFDLVVLGSGSKPEPPSAIKVTPAASVPEKAAAAAFIPTRTAGTTVEGAALVPDRAPTMVVESVAAPFSYKRSAQKALSGLLIYFWSFVLPLALDAFLDHAVKPGFLESVGLPPWLDAGGVYFALRMVRDYRRHQRVPPETEE